MAGPELEQSFGKLVEDLWQALKPLGYRKRGHKFQHQTGDNVALIEFQRSQTSDGDHIKFTINLGVVSGALANRLDPDKDINKMGVWEAHLRERIGSLLPSKDDHWWLLSAATDQITLGREITQCVLNTAVPYLEQVASDDQLVALWRAEKSPGLTAGQRLKYLTLLAS